MRLFSDNATSKGIPIRIKYTINIIATYYTKGVLKLNYNFENKTNEILKYYHNVLFNKKSEVNLFSRSNLKVEIDFAVLRVLSRLFQM